MNYSVGLATVALLVVQTAPVGHRGSEIALVRADGSALRYLTNNRFDDLHPTWSPDRRRIAFTRAGRREGVYVLDLPRTVLRLTRLGDSAPAFSPSGRQIAFVRGAQIMMMSSDGSRTRLLASLTDPTIGPRQLSWSPDGRRLLFAHGGRIKTVDVATGELTALDTGGNEDYRPVYSFDGSQIAFLSYRNPRYNRDADAWGVWEANGDGSSPHRLTTGKFGPLSWAEDGTIVASFGYELATFGVDGTKTDLPVRGRWAEFAP